MNPRSPSYKIFHALNSWLRAPRTTPSPRLIMTLLVKNEAELLEQNLLFHRAMGIDGFIVTDNNSSDKTPEIIRRYRERGWILDVIDEPSTGYNQKKWVDRMIRTAADKFGADWVINADADEFWYAPSCNLKDELCHTRANVLRCRVVNMLPVESIPFTQWHEVVHHIPTPENYNLSPYSIYGREMHKVLHRTAGYVQIAMGNHKVFMLPRFLRPANITVYHFNVRSRKQFVEKMINGGKELEHHTSSHGGRHWRYFYSLYRSGQLEQEYDRVVGLSSQNQLRHDGFITKDTHMSDFFAHLAEKISTEGDK